MQLPDFIKRALAFFDKAEAEFKSSDAAKTKITELEQALAKANTTTSERDATIKDLQGKVTKAEADVTTHAATITDLKGQVAKEKGKANATIAGQGLPADQVPAAETDAGGKAAGENAWKKYQELMAKDSRAAGAYYMANADKIFADRAKE